MQYPYGHAQPHRLPGAASHFRMARHPKPFVHHELAPFPKLTRVGKPQIVPVT